MLLMDERLLELIADQLATNDYAVIDDFLSQEEVKDILKVFDIHQEHGAFKQAAIGSSEVREVDKSVRKDLIKWIDKDQALTPTQKFLNKMDAVKEYLNKTCYLGIKEYETHFTIYPPGAFYKRHLDQFTTSDHRKISFICYLNQDWIPAHGGELRLYLPEGHKDVQPIAGRLACFRSDVVEHEVLLSYAHRYSMTGWMLDQYIDLSFL